MKSHLKLFLVIVGLLVLVFSLIPFGLRSISIPDSSPQDLYYVAGLAVLVTSFIVLFLVVFFLERVFISNAKQISQEHASEIQQELIELMREYVERNFEPRSDSNSYSKKPAPDYIEQLEQLLEEYQNKDGDLGEQLEPFRKSIEELRIRLEADHITRKELLEVQLGALETKLTANLTREFEKMLTDQLQRKTEGVK